MNFDLDEDEELLKAMVERFVADRYDVERRRRYRSEPFGFSDENWQLLGDYGLIEGCFDTEDSGHGLSATALTVLFEELGRGIVVEPLIENVILAGRLFAATARDPLRSQWLPGILSGKRRVALAHSEAGARDNQSWVETRCESHETGCLLSGEKAYVIAGGGADGYIVSARTTGAPGDADGVVLVFVPAGTAGMEVTEWRTADGGSAVALRFERTLIDQAHRLVGGLEDLAAAQTLASLTRTAEALGVMETLFAQTLDYLRTREQFGAPLGSFQAIQHRMVAQYAALEQCRGLLNLAIVSAGGERFAAAVDSARAFVASAALALGHEMIQFHGGMGVTDELAIGAGHKRLLVLSRWPESPGATLDRLAAA